MVGGDANHGHGLVGENENQGQEEMVGGDANHAQ